VERDLKNTESYFRAVTENSSDIIFIVDAGGIITYTSPSVERIIGYRPDELIGTSGFDLILPDDNPRAMEDFARALLTKEAAIPNAFRIRHKDGTERVMEGIGTNLLDNPIVAGFVMNVRDITDRRGAEEALLAANRRLHDIIDFLPDATFAIDKERKVIAWNQAIERMTGVAAADMVGRGDYEYSLPFYGKRQPILIDLVFERGDENATAKYTSIDIRGNIMVAEAYIPFLKGKEAYLWGKASALRDVEGNLIGAIESIRDVTDRKVVEEALRQSETKFRAIFENATEGIFQIAPDGTFLSVNQAFARIFGYASPEELIYNIRYIKRKMYAHPEDRNRIRRLLAETGQLRELECEFIDKQGRKIWVAINAHSISDATGRTLHYEGTVTDITKGKILERQIIHQEKLASLGMLVSGIAHEINNPNNFITFNIPILRDYVGELMRIADAYADRHPDYELFGMTYSEFREDIFNLIENIEHGTARIDGTVRKLQEFSRKKNDEGRRLGDVEEIVGHAVALCRTQIGRTVKIFEVEMAPGLPSMCTDADALEQTLINILINASHAADKEESRITLRVAGGDSWENRIIIEIEDNGAGMDQETQNSIFKPFFTTKPRGKGTGLGLYIANNLIEALGGVIEVESEPGRGSLFRIILPEINING